MGVPVTDMGLPQPMGQVGVVTARMGVVKTGERMPTVRGEKEEEEVVMVEVMLINSPPPRHKQTNKAMR